LGKQKISPQPPANVAPPVQDTDQKLKAGAQFTIYQDANGEIRLSRRYDS
jgi:hypothetical protein